MKAFYTIQRANERGHGNFGWLETRYTYSFANYFNPHRMGFKTLRVLNDDVIDPSSGFGMHPHRDMEIITIMLSGSLAHEDNKGNKGVINKGDVQVMSAGTGIFHSEVNPSDHNNCKLFQIWIETDEEGHAPRYDQRQFESAHMSNQWQLLVSGDENDDALFIHQDARIFMGIIDKDTELVFEPRKGKSVFLMVVVGSIKLFDEHLHQRDAIEIEDDLSLLIKAQEKSKVLIIEV